MKKIFNGIYVFGILFLFSCGSSNNSSSELDSDIKEVSSSQNDTSTNTAGSINTLQVPEQKAQPELTPPTNNNTSADKNTSGVSLNPAHGQPGHRCDIPVGSPLNSPVQSAAPANNTTPANNNTAQQNGLPQQITIPPVTGTPQVPVPTAATGPGLNPAHGQPGHRCDIAVGAPLPKQ